MAAIHRDVDFNSLPRKVREGFVARVTSPGTEGGPLLVEKHSGVMQVLGSLVMLFAGGVLMMFMGAGYGSLDSPEALQGWGNGVFYFLVLAAVFYNLLTTWRRLRLAARVPYPPGKYLFAWDVVDATLDRLKIYPLAQLKNFSAVHHHSYFIYTVSRLEFTFNGGASVRMEVHGKKMVDEALELLRARQNQLTNALNASDHATVARLDPFYELRVANWQLGEPANATPLPAYLKWRAAVAPALALVVVAIALPARNFLSDNARFEEASRLGTEISYKQYTVHGWRHTAQAEAAMPRAAFNDAKKFGTVTAFRRVIASYGKTPGLEGEARQEIDGIYKKALARFREQAATSDPSLLPFMEKLIATLQAEQRPSVQIRFTRPTGSELAAADAKFRNGVGPRGINKVAPVAPHFSAQNAAKREQRIEKELGNAFRVIFPSDVLTVAMPGKLDPRLPTLDIAYEIAPSGTVYSKKDSLRLYVGVIVRFDTTLALADPPVGRRMKFEVLPPDTFRVAGQSVSGDPDDETVYVVMADRAFDQLGSQLRSAFFRPESAAFRQASLTRPKP